MDDLLRPHQDGGNMNSASVAEEKELERLARLLGGGWRYEQGVLPVVILTINEAKLLESRLK